jgi:hypothetical protein
MLSGRSQIREYILYDLTYMKIKDQVNLIPSVFCMVVLCKTPRRDTGVSRKGFIICPNSRRGTYLALGWLKESNSASWGGQVRNRRSSFGLLIYLSKAAPGWALRIGKSWEWQSLSSQKDFPLKCQCVILYRTLKTLPSAGGSRL